MKLHMSLILEVNVYGTQVQDGRDIGNLSQLVHLRRLRLTYIERAWSESLGTRDWSKESIINLNLCQLTHLKYGIRVEPFAEELLLGTDLQVMDITTVELALSSLKSRELYENTPTTATVLFQGRS